MNKIEFSKLSTKEDMILAFNQLKDDYRQLFAINEEQQEENERLNNVINELEKDICNEIAIVKQCELASFRTKSDIEQYKPELKAYYWILSRIKELKEGDKDE